MQTICYNICGWGVETDVGGKNRKDPTKYQESRIKKCREGLLGSFPSVNPSPVRYATPSYGALAIT